MSKKQTPSTKLKKLITENSEILNALLVERIIRIMQMTEEDIKENPKDWDKSIIHESLFHQLNDNVKNILAPEDKLVTDI
jgi:chemotaxis signal transduction protein